MLQNAQSASALEPVSEPETMTSASLHVRTPQLRDSGLIQEQWALSEIAVKAINTGAFASPLVSKEDTPLGDFISSIFVPKAEGLGGKCTVQKGFGRSCWREKPVLEELMPSKLNKVGCTAKSTDAFV